LHFGLLAARAEIFKADEGNDHSDCMLGGHHGTVAIFFYTCENHI
jgi:apyrase